MRDEDVKRTIEGMNTNRSNREWVGLTDQEISEWWWAVTGELPEDSCIVDFARAIEAKLKEKNGG